MIQPDGNVHQPKFWSVVPAEEGSERNRGWQAGHLPSGPRPERLVLWWTDSGLPADVQATLHPILGSSVDIVGAMVHAWLTGEATYPPEPDHDGSNGRGWRVSNGDWGHAVGRWQACIEVEPRWAMYGK